MRKKTYCLLILTWLIFTCYAMDFPEYDTTNPIQEKEASAAGRTLQTLFSGKFNAALMNGVQRWHWTRHVFASQNPSNSEEILHAVNHTAEKDCLCLHVGKASTVFPIPGTKQTYSVECGIQKTFPLKPEFIGKTVKAVFQYTGTGVVDAIIQFDSKKLFLQRDSNASGNLTVTAAIPGNADKVSVHFWLRDTGKTYLTDGRIEVIEPEVPTSIDARLYVNSFLTGDFQLPDQGYSMPANFIFLRPDSRKRREVKLEIILSEGYEISGGDKMMPLLHKENGRYIFNLTKYINFWSLSGKYDRWVYPCLMLRSRKKAGFTGVLRSRVIDEGQPGRWRKITLKTVPFVHVAAPRHFWFGYQQTRGGNLDAGGARELLKVLQGSGMNSFCASNDTSQELNTEMQKAGFELFNCAPAIRDGYFMMNAPREFHFLNPEGKRLNHYICPEELATRGSFYQNTVEKQFITPKVKDWTNHWIVNWEPYPADYQGCSCQRCRKAFAGFANLDEAELQKMKFTEITRRYHDKWIRFRSLQHAMIIKNLEESMVRYAEQYGRKCHFMPEVSYACFYENLNKCPQYDPRDYLKYMKEIAIWGPYLEKGNAFDAYRYQTAQNLLYHVAARQTMSFVRRKSGTGAPPEVLLMPFGMNQPAPRAIRGFVFDCVSAFLTGCRGIHPWGGFYLDYRGYRIIGEIADIIRSYETIPRTWQPGPKVTSRLLTPAITPAHWVQLSNKHERIYPELKKIDSPLLVETKQKDGRVFIAAGNFWELEPLYCRLQLKTTLRGRLVINFKHLKCHMLTNNSELSSGFLMRIPPLGWNCCIIEQYVDGRDYGRLLTGRTLEQQLQKELPRIKRGKAYEDKLLQNYNHIVSVSSYDFGACPVITGGTTSVSELKENSVQKLRITGKNYSAVLNPRHGGSLTSLIIDGEEKLYTAKDSAFGTAGFWMPYRKNFHRPFQVMDISSMSDGVKVILERRDENNDMKVRLIYSFLSGRIQESAEITNHGKHTLPLAFRFHFDIKNARQGSILEHDGEKIMRRTGSHMLTGDLEHKEKEIMKDALDKIKIYPILKSKSQVFCLQEGASRIFFQSFTPLFGIYSWKSDQGQFRTFEPTFMPGNGKLSPGEKQTYKVEWRW